MTLATSQFVKAWTDAGHLDGQALRAVLVDVRERARFVPGRWDPLSVWWNDKLQG